MKRISRSLLSITLIALLAGMFVSAASIAADDSEVVNIAFIHDLHSYLDGYSEMKDGAPGQTGGVSKIKTLLDDFRSEDPNLIVLDGGDFSMGTLYQTVYRTKASELRTLGKLGVEVTTVGNHEFDCGAEGFYSMFEAALQSGDELPQFVVSNIDWDTMNSEGITDDQKLYRECFDDYGVKDYVMLHHGDMDIAVFGIFGKDALACAPTCVLKFKDPIEAATQTVAEIKKNEDPDLIIALSHSGTGETIGDEDVELAKAVQDIDLIISAHTHTVLPEPIREGRVTIASAGCYGAFLGNVKLKKNGNNWDLLSYKLYPIDDEITPDPELDGYVKSFRQDVQTGYLDDFGYVWDEVIAHNDIVFDTVDDCYNNHVESRLGDLLTDGFDHAADLSDTAAEEGKFDVTVAPSGCIRGTFVPGDVTVSEVFNTYSLGIGPDDRMGYPLVSLYLTGEELMTLCEVDASVSDMMDTARLYMHGIGFTYNPHRLILNKVTEVHIDNEDGTTSPVEKDKLYHVAADLYSTQMLGAVTDLSKGLLTVVPKDKNGVPISDMKEHIIMTDGRELKAWEAVAQYVCSFENDEFPEYYNSLHNRKNVDDSTSLSALISHPNKYAIIIAVVVIVLILLIVLLITGIVKLIKKLAKKRKKS
ncbi:MAG: 5'-nucleotidase C-terminal domain-containing protein [Lachnospiraceae bacterium]|nr:5'-nucleotidase C-terminal domain-containing protein [Lachnospiraceae bacterium]